MSKKQNITILFIFLIYCVVSIIFLCNKCLLRTYYVLGIVLVLGLQQLTRRIPRPQDFISTLIQLSFVVCHYNTSWHTLSSLLFSNFIFLIQNLFIHSFIHLVS